VFGAAPSTDLFLPDNVLLGLGNVPIQLGPKLCQFERGPCALQDQVGQRPQSSSASRFTAGASEFFILSQSGRAAGTVGGVLALRDDAFEAKLAGVGEDRRAVALDMLVEPDARSSLRHDRCERGFADLQRIAPQVVAVLFDQVEGVKEYALVSALDEIERGNAVVIASDSLAIDELPGRL
jgi:hypothetical protein